jgi:hypothetical protein
MPANFEGRTVLAEEIVLRNFGQSEDVEDVAVPMTMDALGFKILDDVLRSDAGWKFKCGFHDGFVMVVYDRNRFNFIWFQ